MKIGILTYWGVPNYGAWTQAYAFNRLLNKLYPNEEIKHIAYLEQSHWDNYYKKDKKGLNNFLYNWNEIPHTDIFSEAELEDYECDILITGSDSIWEEIITGTYNPDCHLVGMCMPKCKKVIAYAPSAGIKLADNCIPLFMKEGFMNYSAISVRDENTQLLVSNNIGILPEIVLDPSMLWEFSIDENVKGTSYKNYILVYGCSWDTTFIRHTVEFARQNKLTLISVGFINNWCDVNFKRIELRGLEWIGMFRSATYVVTSTFHGLMVGINLNKQIKFCQVDYVKNRSQTLIEILNIPNHKEDYYAEIDYCEVNSRLYSYKTKSIAWLINAIENS